MHIRQNSIVKALRVVKHVSSGTIEPVTTTAWLPLPLRYRYSDRSTNQIVCDTQNATEKNLVAVI